MPKFLKEECDFCEAALVMAACAILTLIFIYIDEPRIKTAPQHQEVISRPVALPEFQLTLTNNIDEYEWWDDLQK